MRLNHDAGNNQIIDAAVVLAVLINEPEREKIVSRTAGCYLLAPGCPDKKLLPYSGAEHIPAVY